jgi:hypothetical protein
LSKLVFLSVVFVPALVGWWASGRGGRSGFLRLLAAVLAFDALYVAALLVIYSRWY